MDLEDIVFDKRYIDFVEELSIVDYTDRKHYDKTFSQLRKKYKINPKKTDINKCVKKINQKNITQTFIDFSKRKIGKSSSGVAVITVLTSPFPEYTDSNNNRVKQKFSCGSNCAYCPNEPEVKLDLIVKDIISTAIISNNNTSKKYIIYCEKDLNHIRTINYIVFKNKKINVIDCFNFKKNEFILKINSQLNKNDQFIGVKIAQPRSYISSEPAVLRANKNNFSAEKQFDDRCNTLSMMGHPIDKIEIIVLGGTWDHYPIEYRKEFIRDIYYSANYFNKKKKDKQCLENEIKLNETSSCRIIGITTETRPDCITVKEIKNLRKMNITRVQLGVQHIDDDVLKTINRGCQTKHTIRANYLLKQNGYKVDMHFMPDLPGSTFEKDLEMFKKLFSHKKTIINKNYIKYNLEYPELQADQLKIYPCSTVEYTDIKKWYDQGTYKPYSEDRDKLIEIILYIKTNIFPWIRLNRIIRDIPQNWIDGGNRDVSLRQHVLSIMKQNDLSCNCIRCREPGSFTINDQENIYLTREYNGYNSTEYFISCESKNKKILFGFIRLSIKKNNDDLCSKFLEDSAFIRELHVYGKLTKHDKYSSNIQHKGIGKKLLKMAEKITIDKNIKKLSIISGVGVREYYFKQGYRLNKNNQFMEKYLNDTKKNDCIYNTLILICFIVYFSIMYDLYILTF